MPTRRDIFRWQLRTPAEQLASSQYSRAKRLNDGKPNGFWTGRQWKRLCARAGWRCAWCGKPMDKLVPDHIVPLARGGTNDLSNIVPSCPACNLRRGAKPVWQWVTFEAFERLYRRLHPGAADELFGPAEGDEQAA